MRSRLDQAGHRGDVRALALASDDAALITASASGAKLWSPASGACVGTLEGGYGLCCVFAPGNRHAVIGTKVRVFVGGEGVQRWAVMSPVEDGYGLCCVLVLLPLSNPSTPLTPNFSGGHD